VDHSKLLERSDFSGHNFYGTRLEFRGQKAGDQITHRSKEHDNMEFLKVEWNKKSDITSNINIENLLTSASKFPSL
jgi:hypothetical protein